VSNFPVVQTAYVLVLSSLTLQTSYFTGLKCECRQAVPTAISGGFGEQHGMQHIAFMWLVQLHFAFMRELVPQDVVLR